MQPKNIEIAMAVLRQGDSFMMQQRGFDKNIGAAGMIGFFGGKLEPGESPLQAVCREIGEETSLVLDPETGTFQGEVDVPSDMYNQTIKVHANVFDFAVPEGIEATASDGDLILMTAQELAEARSRLTPATAAWLDHIA